MCLRISFPLWHCLSNNDAGPIFGPASTIIQESPAAVPANPEPFDEDVTLGRPLSAGSSEPTAPKALATPQVELGSSMLRRQDGRNDDPANQNTNQSNKSSFKFTTGRKQFASKLLQITTPSRKTKTNASSTLQLSSILVQPPGHLSLCMAEIITESKKRPYQELIDGTDKVSSSIIHTSQHLTKAGPRSRGGLSKIAIRTGR